MAVYDDTVFGVNGKSCHMAHQVGGEFGGKLSAVGVAPQQFRSLTVGSDADNAQIALGVGIHILKILARAGDDEDFARNRGHVKAQRDGAPDCIQVKVLPYFGFVQQIADVAAIALIPAKAVHIRGSFPHFLHKGSK